MMQKFILSIAVLVTAFSIEVSSGYAANQNVRTGPKVHLPVVGTVIINTYYVTDSSGALVPRSKADPEVNDDTLRVIRSNFRALGRSRCVAFYTIHSKDTTLISYAPHGDLYVRDLAKDSAWHLLPFGLPPGTIMRKKLPNDSGMVMLRNYNMPHTRTYQVTGRDTVSVQGKTYHCIELLITDIREWQGQNWVQGTRYWLSPELGYFIRSNMGWDGPYFLNQQTKVWQFPSGLKARNG